MNMASFFKPWVGRSPDKTAIIFEDRRISYAGFDKLVNKVANGLPSLRLKRGDVVSLFLPSLPELLMGYLGAVRAGLVVNVVNAMLKDIEVEYILKDCETKAVIVDKGREPILDKVRASIKSMRHKILLAGDKDDPMAFEYIMGKASDQFTPVEVNEEDLCHLMYTSGTTGWPKGVMATHKNITHNLTEFGKIQFKDDDTIIMVATPIFHCWGLVNGTFGMLNHGGTVITVEQFYPEKALDDIKRLRPTCFIGVPPMYNLFVKTPDVEKRNIDSIVFCLSAATKMPVELIRLVEEKLKWRYAEAWGLTEVSCVGTTAPYNETRIGSCGYGMADTKAKVIDENGNEVSVGQRGELCVKGTCVPRGI